MSVWLVVCLSVCLSGCLFEFSNLNFEIKIEECSHTLDRSRGRRIHFAMIIITICHAMVDQTAVCMLAFLITSTYDDDPKDDPKDPQNVMLQKNKMRF